ncbi:3-hydroxyacyl-ACP dehydratase FabZ family protein [Robertkochia aurantiaca]|uniref:3-hydroxyacyl-ACP dehydratase FabZ family protein n=1 Tax=Robertkochia aurantiaca TaxID=2873700 RepID=UPI001CD00779|nr:hydroxymyristoyl-ACP dehydratase [Robertkochia sp. 3YJGBD-33]
MEERACNNYSDILELLPYASPFHFVDEIESLSANSAKGSYTFPEDAFYYRGHFPGNPVTPGVILTECCAQIGLVTLGIYLIKKDHDSLGKDDFRLAFTQADIQFLSPAYPGQKVHVVSEKEYFRFHKLKAAVKMFDESGTIICKGVLSGMLKLKDEK